MNAETAVCACTVETDECAELGGCLDRTEVILAIPFCRVLSACRCGIGLLRVWGIQGGDSAWWRGRKRRPCWITEEIEGKIRTH